MDDAPTMTIRVPPNLRKLIETFLDSSATYLNLSEFARAALREKMNREAPWLYKEMMKPEGA